MSTRIRSLILVFSIALAACSPSKDSGTALAGTRWKLNDLQGQEVLPGTLISLLFGEAGITGSAGCNAYGATYSLQPRQGIAFEEIARNLEGCLEPEGVMAQEDQYHQALWAVTRYQLEGDGLTLFDEAGEALLQYERMPEYDVDPADLLGRMWRLTSATGLAEESLPAFSIQFDGREFQGTTICRDYAGKYQASGDTLQVTFLEMTTDQDCDDQALGAEGGYTTLLENVAQYNLSPGRLEFYTRRGEVLTFEFVTGE